MFDLVNDYIYLFENIGVSLINLKKNSPKHGSVGLLLLLLYFVLEIVLPIVDTISSILIAGRV